VADVRRFPLVTRSGARVPLGEVSVVTTGSEPPEVRRFQRARTVTVEYDFDPRTATSGAAVESVRQSVDRLAQSVAVPPGHAIEVEHADRGLSDQKKMLYLGVGLVYVVLAIAFESLLLPLLILPCVLLALIGVVWALALTGTPLNAYVMLGGIVLLGIVVNNGILFVDRSQALLAAGARRPTAVLRAAHDRLRPVLMTTSTTVLGLLPLAVSTGGQQEIWPPFGRAVIGGLVASTAISLVFVPAGTLLLGRLTDVFRRLGWPLATLGILLGLATLASLRLGPALEAFAGLLHAVGLPDVRGSLGGLVGFDLVTNELLLWALAPVLLVGFPALLRAAQHAWRGEGRFDLVSDDGPVDVRVRSVRKVYGGPARLLRDARVTERWRDLARRHGLGLAAIEPPSVGWSRLAWQLGLLALLAVLHVLAESAWGLFLLSLPGLLLLDGVVDSLLGGLGRPGAWPRPGWLGRLWRLGEALAAWGYLFLRQRPDSTSDDVTLVVAGIVLGAWAFLNVAGFGGLTGLARRILAPEPVEALSGVDLAFGVGLHGLLGPNGAGKSTLMRLVVNLYRATRGTVTVNGHDLVANAASLQARIGYLPQFFGVPPRLTAREYLHHQALLAGRTDAVQRARLVDEVLREVGLAERADERLGGYSGGMRQRVGIARTLLNVPRLVVVDEPTVGLDPRERIRFRNLLAELAKTRVVLLSTHVVEDIGSACQDVVVLDRGRVLFRGSPQGLVTRAEGKAWILDAAESQLTDLAKRHRVVATTRLVGGRVRVRGVGAPPAGAEAAQPTLEDAYLLLLGRVPGAEGGHAA
jgi:ABC-type multidrug transport system ATPase subunit